MKRLVRTAVQRSEAVGEARSEVRLARGQWRSDGVIVLELAIVSDFNRPDVTQQRNSEGTLRYRDRFNGSPRRIISATTGSLAVVDRHRHVSRQR